MFFCFYCFGRVKKRIRNTVLETCRMGLN